MRRLALTLLLTVATLCAPAGASASASRVAGVPLTSAKLRECRVTAEPANRVAVFRTRMAAVRSTDRMSVTFQLLVRRPGADDFTPVDAPGLGQANLSAPGIDVFGFSQEVRGLDAPAEYRARVFFRWLDDAGHVVRRDRDLTPVCRQPDPRPDLRIERTTATSTEGPGLARYAVLIRNAGRGDAGSFDVALNVDGVAQPPITVSGVGAGDSRTVSFVARRCRDGGDVRVVLDPDDRIEEADDVGNAHAYHCPLPTTR